MHAARAHQHQNQEPSRTPVVQQEQRGLHRSEITIYDCRYRISFIFQFLKLRGAIFDERAYLTWGGLNNYDDAIFLNIV